MIHELTTILTSDPRHASFLRGEIALLLGHFCAAQEDIERAQSIVTEAFSNVVRHAYEETGAVCRISLKLDDNKLVIMVIDEGRGFQPIKEDDQPSIWRDSGRGMFFIHSMSDEVCIESIPEKGTVLTAEIGLNGKKATFKLGIAEG